MSMDSRIYSVNQGCPQLLLEKDVKRKEKINNGKKLWVFEVSGLVGN